MLPSYSSYTKPPIMLENRIVQFTCEVCHRMGFGAPNAKVHAKCKAAWRKQRVAARKQRRAQTAEVA